MRKKKLTPEITKKAFNLARRGLIDQEICAALNISRNSFYKWMRENKAFEKAVIKGREDSIEEVENAMFKAAVGYEYEEIHKTVKNVDGVETKEIKTIKKLITGSTTAQIFILKNRKPEQYNDRKEVEHSGAISVDHTATKIVFESIDEDEPVNAPETENE